MSDSKNCEEQERAFLREQFLRTLMAVAVCNKMSQPFIKKPFTKKTFYLDLKYFQNQEEFMKDLKKLGGKVESFLSKDVTHVLTDRREFSKRQALASDGTVKNTPSRSSSKTHTSPLGYFNSPVYSPANDYGRVRSPIASRGLTLVQKAKQKREGTTDILEVCAQWNIKIVHVEVVTAVIHKCQVEYTKQVNLLMEQQRKNDAEEIEPQRLSIPFIKVEDANEQYRPVYKEFKRWHNMVDSDLHSAFSTVMQDVGLRNSLNTPTISEHNSTGVLKAVNGYLRPKNSINFKIYPVMPSEESLRSVKRAKINEEDAKENLPLPHKDEKIKGCSSILLRNPKDEPIKKLKRKRYCEICRHSYVELDDHLLSKTHQKFINNPNNFRELEEIIQTMPSATQFLNKWKNQEKEETISRHTSSHEWMSQLGEFEDSEELGNCKDGASINLLSALPIPQWQTVGNYLGDAENIGPYANVNQEYYNNIISCFPLESKTYATCKNTNDISIYCGEKSIFNISPSLSVPYAGDGDYYHDRKEFSEHAINLCTRNLETVPKDIHITQSATELYDFDSEGLISASCSSIELSSRLPYLQDSIEKLFPYKRTIGSGQTSSVIECATPSTSAPKKDGIECKLFAVL